MTDCVLPVTGGNPLLIALLGMLVTGVGVAVVFSVRHHGMGRGTAAVIAFALAAASLVLGDARRADAQDCAPSTTVTPTVAPTTIAATTSAAATTTTTSRHDDDCRDDHHDDRDRRCDPHDAHDRGDDHDELDDDFVLEHVLDYDDRPSARPGADHRWWQHSGQHVVPRAGVPDRDHQRRHCANDGNDDFRRASARGVSASRRRTHRRDIQQRRRRLDRR